MSVTLVRRKSRGKKRKLPRVRVGSQAFNKLGINTKIRVLCSKGYYEAAFGRKKNAITFAKECQRKGRKNLSVLRSSGPTVDNIKGPGGRGYYVISKR